MYTVGISGTDEIAELAPGRLARDKRWLQLVRIMGVELVLGSRLARRLHFVLRAVLVERRGHFGCLWTLRI